MITPATFVKGKVHLVNGTCLSGIVFLPDKNYAAKSLTVESIHKFVSDKGSAYFVQGHNILYVEIGA